jgi:TRAP-type mannitol/chloroaromatic compound transport system permease large subunit
MKSETNPSMPPGGIARRLIDFAKVLVGRFPGGLAFVHVIAAMLFGSISGSAVASSAIRGCSIRYQAIALFYSYKLKEHHLETLKARGCPSRGVCRG